MRIKLYIQSEMPNSGMEGGGFLPVVKQPKREADHLTQPTVTRLQSVGFRRGGGPTQVIFTKWTPRTAQWPRTKKWATKISTSSVVWLA
jgi:hypothetical protein